MSFLLGIFALVWYAAWEYMSYDSPANHPTITKAERYYIERSIGGNAFDPLVSNKNDNVDKPGFHIIARSRRESQ